VCLISRVLSYLDMAKCEDGGSVDTASLIQEMGAETPEQRIVIRHKLGVESF